MIQPLVIFRAVDRNIACDALVMEFLGMAFGSEAPPLENIAQFRVRVRLPGWENEGSNQVEVIGYDGCYVSDLLNFQQQLRDAFSGDQGGVTLEGYTSTFRISVEPQSRPAESALVLGRVRAPACPPESWKERACYALKNSGMPFPFSMDFAFNTQQHCVLEAASQLECIADSIRNP